MIGAIVIASVVLLTSFPLEGLLAQRAELSSTGRELNSVNAQNEALTRQVSVLGETTTINDLARLDYGFVRRGQRAYDILPSSSPTGSALSASGLVPLDGPPVVPGSARSEALIGVADPTGAPTSSGTVRTHSAGTRGALGASADEPPEPHSYWGRVVRSLEFWN